MNDVDILSRVAAYESSHRVEDYVVDGWHVWPLLRTAICLRWLSPARTTRIPAITALARKYLGPASLAGRRILPVLRYFAYLKAAIGQRRSARDHLDRPDDRRADAVFMSLSERRVLVDGVAFEIYTDPFVDLLNELGFRSLVWEQGDGHPAQHSGSTKMMDRLNAEALVPPRSPGEPDWFADYAALAEGIFGKQIAWAEVSPMIVAATDRSSVLERWLRKVNPRVLFLVCWYDPIAMSVIMSARRCGVKTIEIQHSSQGEGHFGYCSWMRAPANGYEVVPDVFWCWGKTGVEELRELCPGFFARSSAVAGGHLWLNRWRRSARKSVAALKPARNATGNVRRILVTLQTAVPSLLLETIATSPSTWEWMIRFHPSRGSENRAADSAQLMQTGHPGIELGRPNEILLFDLLDASDVHVTECSSCAIEALAFGVPTVILGGSELGETGKTLFQTYIEKKLMSAADSASDAMDAIKSASRIAQTEPTIMNLFAGHDAATAALGRLLRNPVPEGAPL